MVKNAPPTEKPLPVGEAVAALKKFNTTKFDQTVEIAMHLGIDPKQADQLVRGSIVLPHGIGKSQRVVVFAKGDKLDEAKAAGADEVGGPELAEKIKGGWTDFEVCIATPDMMGVVGPLGKVLGPRGLMPSPRAGTVTPDVTKAIREYKAGKVEFRTKDEGGNIHAVVGKLSFDAAKLAENVYILDNVAVVPGLDGQKMSKSCNNSIEIFDEPATIRKKVKRIVTDSTPVEAPEEP